ncbi:WbqC family protein [Pontibacter sp. SD6]|uniref:WbqC family protein n=2 Tax=Pontibacter cellulosilyticus TaxID=1720253 RepID=A0A923N360_9BACT|nr:WbqC family protein [Pontibacter cellulosilyticus]
MQPYFFPYVGYYSLIKHTDEWIIFDVVQFIRHGWIERNRILKPGEGWQYISVPLQKHSRDTPIKDIIIKNDVDWRDKILRQLDHYKKRAPYFNQVTDLVKAGLNINTDSIVNLNANILKVTCNYLEIPFDYKIFSQMELEIEPVSHPGEWALHITKALNFDTYINPPGGVNIFSDQQFKAANIKLSFLKNAVTPYNQKRPSFEGGLSIIDVLMFNDISSANQLIDDIKFIDPYSNKSHNNCL